MFEEIKLVREQGIGGESPTTDPYSMFVFAPRSPKTREKCAGRLRIFFDIIGIPGDSMAERSKVFCDRAKIMIIIVIVADGLLGISYNMYIIKRKFSAYYATSLPHTKYYFILFRITIRSNQK